MNQNTQTIKLTATHPLFSPQTVRKEPLSLQCEVMFGSPSSNCGGNGICKIVAKNHQPGLQAKRTSCSHAHAVLTAWNDGKGVSLIFRREWLCANLMRRHLRHGILEMPEPCPIPPAVVAALDLKVNMLPAGLHLVEDLGMHLRLHFAQGASYTLIRKDLSDDYD